ncbi:bifunctional metallophosphatase/5'-nucleotidase [Novosphingobium sp. 1949]|uniref:Bifunctional metallophosphatase/5'-nucleotidase n=1 Tax=Novosphingobium organovorum TaxID=2930092 RepID=A0ABT0BAM4_9SPHN|nr:bifunctional metallophosphatase/5'-nucleotidase [Novosphingobium organovorum]MCJ2182104.1 bifunctional metallophosphatase/5'-nucleotidase [Novosphingobium organovorum]
MTSFPTRARALTTQLLAAPLLVAPLLTASLLAACASVPASGPTADAAPATAAPVDVGILAFNDFHGNIEAPKASISWPDGKGGTVQVPAGGAAQLASALDALRKDFRYSATVSAGDLISASPLASSLFLDEPTIGVMNRLKLDFNSVGNHEFDRGRKELLRIQNGGCEKNTLRQPCQLEAYKGANFQYLSASTYTEDGKTLFPATGIKSFGTGKDKVVIGFVGLTLKDTPTLVSPGGINGLRFGDEAEAINRAVPVLLKEGADAIVVLIHQGGAQSDTSDPNACTGFSGDIDPILAKISPRVDVVISGHTHQAYICERPRAGTHPLLLTSAGSYGRLVTRMDLKIDPASRRVLSASARNVPVQSQAYTTAHGSVPNTDLVTQYAPRPDIQAYVQRYVDAARTYAQRTVGHLSGSALRNWAGEDNERKGGSLDELIADSQLAATKANGAQIAFMNTGGVRANLEPGAEGAVTFAKIYAVQPFGNTLSTRTYTGAEIKAVLESGVGAKPSASLLIPSANVTYTIDMSQPVGQRITALTYNGQPMAMDARFRVTMNSFLEQGGDGYTGFTKGTEPTVGGLDLDALEAWMSAVPVRQVPTEHRVRILGK